MKNNDFSEYKVMIVDSLWLASFHCLQELISEILIIKLIYWLINIKVKNLLRVTWFLNISFLPLPLVNCTLDFITKIIRMNVTFTAYTEKKQTTKNQLMVHKKEMWFRKIDEKGRKKFKKRNIERKGHA
jgi:hypothetical protein